MQSTSLIVHGHFYQPPREDPRTGEIPREVSAAPFHDWNARIAAECYRPNAFAEIIDQQGNVEEIVNNFERMSFDIGPTLFSWLQTHEPDIYQRILQADRVGGGAIAQPYGHVILPLANRRDLRTQIRWGLADFAHRFGRDAQGMWLPETAANDDVLAALAAEGVGFTILAPSQATATRPLAGGEWKDVSDGSIDTTITYRWSLPAGPGGGVDLIFFDRELSQALAFDIKGAPSAALIDAVEARSIRGGLVTLATDGETFGHHHRFADRALAHALAYEAPARGIEVTNASRFLERSSPTHEVTIRESSWSCVHGVGRWSEDCGCSDGGMPGDNQRWRAPLRAALDFVRGVGIEIFERRGEEVFTGPWAAREAYVDVLLGAATHEEFAEMHIHGDAALAFSLLEAQRHAMMMYTSCGWFFHDLAGLEGLLILRHAARAIDLLRDTGENFPEAEFLEILDAALTNDKKKGSGAQVWRDLVLQAQVFD